MTNLYEDTVLDPSSWIAIWCQTMFVTGLPTV